MRPEPAASALYDARRRVFYAKPVLRGWLHVVWFGGSLLACPLLVARGHGTRPVTALVVYAVSVTGLFGTSALYHRGTWSPAWSVRLQRADHLMIFFLIAGTATPVFLLAASGAFGLICLIGMWTLVLTAAAVHLSWMSAPEAVVGATFIGLGSRCRRCGATSASRPERSCSRAAWSTSPGPCLITGAGRIRRRRCSATTRSSTPAYARRRPASTSR
jgi:hemolysin III